MTEPDRPGPVAPSATKVLATTALVASIAGAATAWGQFWLPDALGSLANSSGSWSVVAFVLALRAPRPGVAASSGTIALLALLAGYVLAAAHRGDPSSRSLLVFWGIAAVVAGPAIGLAAHAIARGSTGAAVVGVGSIAGVLVGEGIYGLTVVADTTSPPYWWAQIAVGAGFLAAVSVRRLRRARLVGAACGVTAVVAVSFICIYRLDLMSLLS